MEESARQVPSEFSSITIVVEDQQQFCNSVGMFAQRWHLDITHPAKPCEKRKGLYIDFQGFCAQNEWSFLEEKDGVENILGFHPFQPWSLSKLGVDR